MSSLVTISTIAVPVLLLMTMLSSAAEASLDAHDKSEYRSKEEVDKLHAERHPDGLHNRIDGVFDLAANYFDDYVYHVPHYNREEGRSYWLVVFYASWCGKACDSMIEPLRELSSSLVHPNKNDDEATAEKKKATLLRFAKHDVTPNEKEARKYNIDAYPTVLLFDREVKGRITIFEGERTAENLMKFLRENTKLSL